MLVRDGLLQPLLQALRIPGLNRKSVTILSYMAKVLPSRSRARSSAPCSVLSFPPRGSVFASTVSSRWFCATAYHACESMQCSTSSHRASLLGGQSHCSTYTCIHPTTTQRWQH